jgi:tetratricopeptide (TPR) repeat protein
MNVSCTRGALFILLAGLTVGACSNPDAQKRQHLERGDQYAAEKRDEFAVVEYASAVQIDPMFGEARLKLAETHERMGNLVLAAPEYIRAADALPDHRDAQIKATEILLLGRRFDDAKARAAKLLEKNPKDVDAILLHANAMAALRDPAGALTEIEEALKISPDSSRALVNLGAVRMQTGDAKQAEDAFRQAIALDPSSTSAQLALANFLWAAGRAPEAEAALKDILSKEPQHLLANRMLGVLYISTRRANEAEGPLKTVAEVSKSSEARFQLADYYAGVGRPQDATEVLKSLSSEQAAFADAELRIAALEYDQGRVAEAHQRLDGVLGRAPNFAPGLVAKAQWLTRENKLDEALQRAKAAVSADPQSANAHFTLAVVHDRRQEIADATKEYSEALRLNPRAVSAQVELSRLSLRSGDSATALRFAEEASQTQPASLSARVAMARSLVAAGNLERADREISTLLKGAPNAAAVHAVNGLYQARKNNAAAARAAYERSLELTPGYLEALGGLTFLDIAEKKPAQAVSRLEAEAARKPSSPLLALLARANGAAGNQAKEEEVLRQAVTSDPRFTAGYTMLAQLYMRQNRIANARAEFEGIVKRDPNAIGARTMVGMLLETEGKTEEAKRSYEETVKADENAAVAANNLAFIYAEQGTNLDMALQLATNAKRRLPEDPNVDDTIGWIYYKKDLPAMAVAPLEASLKRLTNPAQQAEVLYHLGLTYAKLGDKAKARNALESALKLNPQVGGAETRRVLATVS